MSSRVGVPAIYDTSPVSSNVRRGAPVHRRAQSEPGFHAEPATARRPASEGGVPQPQRRTRMPGALSTSDRSIASFEGFIPRQPYPSTSAGSSTQRARLLGLDTEELYENYFIGSTKLPKNQNQILEPAVVSKVEKEEAKKERESELSDAIKMALGTKRKAHKYPNKVATRQYSGVLAERVNSTTPKNFWTTAKVNAYRMRKM